MDRAHRLLEKGYFPSQLPPPFHTEDLALHHEQLYTKWFAAQKPPKKGERIFPKAPKSKLESFSVARAGHKRRAISLPNPVAQTYLVHALIPHWGKLVALYRKSRLSVSHPRFIRSGIRATSIPTMQHLYDKKILMSAGYRFFLKTDISRFFPTIYTHSIPWALHGKAEAKKKENRGFTDEFFGNLIDLAFRQAQDEQTIGIPIGPDTSHMIAEAIATAIDLALKSKLNYWPPGFRYVDDYYLFFKKSSDAESALAALMKCLKDFELQINFEKTKISSIQDVMDDYWTHQLTNINISNDVAKQKSNINQFFELAKKAAKANPDESVMTYAVKRLGSTVIHVDNWSCLEAHLCHTAMGHPNSLQTIARLLTTYKNIDFPLNKDRLTILVNSIIEDHVDLNHHSEVAWCLWICKDLELKVASNNVDALASMHSSVCALLLMDLDSLGLTAKKPSTTFWKKLENKNSLFDDLWLLSYEAGIKGWAGFRNAHIASDPSFNELKIRDISFYSASKNLTPIFHLKEEFKETQLTEIFKNKNYKDFFEYEKEEVSYETADPSMFFATSAPETPNEIPF
jgi:Tfp pilus assembly protein PilE